MAPRRFRPVAGRWPRACHPGVLAVDEPGGELQPRLGLPLTPFGCERTGRSDGLGGRILPWRASRCTEITPALVDASSFSTRRAALIADDSLQGLEFAVAYSALADEWVRELLGSEPGVAVIAAGALGRRELAPGSDLDLVLVHDGRRDAAEIAQRIWYPIWDARISLDHSVRTPKEAVALSETDLKVVLGLLDGRPVAGDEALGQQVLLAVRERWISRIRKRLDELQAIGDDRHAKDGDVAHLLGPDLKQSKGGLRDLRV